MITDKNLTLAANYETLLALKNKEMEAILWEDSYSNDDLLELYKNFRKFCNEWFFDENGVDFSLYDGMSFGKAISIFLAYDTESWIRVLFLFEYFASNRQEVKFYVPDDDYFPSLIYGYTEELNSLYETEIKIISLNINNLGIEPSLKQIVEQKRLISELKKTPKTNSIKTLDKIKKKVIQIGNPSVRCFIQHIRNSDEYLSDFLNSEKVSDDIHLYFSQYYFVHRRLFFNDLLKNRLTFINDDIEPINVDDEALGKYLHILGTLAKRSTEKASFLNQEGKKYFTNIFTSYIQQLMHEQILRYSYLEYIFKKYKINATLCDGPDTPETFYCKHLMDKLNGKSFFLPHGLIRKDKELDRWRNEIAHYYFNYTESEKEILSGEYEIPKDHFFPVNFLNEKN